LGELGEIGLVLGVSHWSAETEIMAHHHYFIIPSKSNSELAEISEWLAANKLRFNASISKLLIFSYQKPVNARIDDFIDDFSLTLISKSLKEFVWVRYRCNKTRTL